MGANRKGGVKTQRGWKRKESAVKMQGNYYSSKKLIEVTKHRGYYNVHSVAVALSQDTGLSVSTLENKISSGHFSREEMIVIASYFEMTPKEFCDVFLNGLFNENHLGHFIAHVDSAYAVLHPQRTGGQKKETKRNSREEMLKDVVEQIGKL